MCTRMTQMCARALRLCVRACARAHMRCESLDIKRARKEGLESVRSKSIQSGSIHVDYSSSSFPKFRNQERRANRQRGGLLSMYDVTFENGPLGKGQIETKVLFSRKGANLFMEIFIRRCFSVASETLPHTHQ